MTTRTINVSDIVFRKDLYPRLVDGFDGPLIQKYAETLDQLPPIEVNQHNILIDGYHRWKAYETNGETEVPCVVFETESENQLFLRSCGLNSKFGKQMSNGDKKAVCIRLYGTLEVAEICSYLSISERTFERWTTDKRRHEQEQLKKNILDLWLACHSEKQICEQLNLPQKTVNDEIADFSEKRQLAGSANFGNFERELFSTWSFSKIENSVKHYGNVPREVVDNLLYSFTEPFDVVFDPFGGGGSTIDVCRDRLRRYYVSDLNPIPAREHDIRKHDITTGLPKDLPVPDFVYLDPPYWIQAKDKYSTDETDLGNVGLDEFLLSIGSIVRLLKRRWGKLNRKKPCYLALIIGVHPIGESDIDLPFLCYEVISKYLPLHRRFDVPYSTQQHQAYRVAQVKKERDVWLSLARSLMVFRYVGGKSNG